MGLMSKKNYFLLFGVFLSIFSYSCGSSYVVQCEFKNIKLPLIGDVYCCEIIEISLLTWNKGHALGRTDLDVECFFSYGHKLETPFKEAYRFKNLKALALIRSGANLETKLIKDRFKSLTKLEYLDLPFNDISYLNDDVFEDLIKLQYLDLSNNKLTWIYKNLFKKNIELKVIRLGNNQFKTKLEPFENLKNLESLTVEQDFQAYLENKKKCDIIQRYNIFSTSSVTRDTTAPSTSSQEHNFSKNVEFSKFGGTISESEHTEASYEENKSLFELFSENSNVIAFIFIGISILEALIITLLCCTCLRKPKTHQNYSEDTKQKVESNDHSVDYQNPCYGVVTSPTTDADCEYQNIQIRNDDFGGELIPDYDEVGLHIEQRIKSLEIQNDENVEMPGKKIEHFRT